MDRRLLVVLVKVKPRESGLVKELTSMLIARTALLCLQSAGGAVKYTHRIGILKSVASCIHSFLVGSLALVLSRSYRIENNSEENKSCLTDCHGLPITEMLSGYFEAIRPLKHWR